MAGIGALEMDRLAARLLGEMQKAADQVAGPSSDIEDWEKEEARWLLDDLKEVHAQRHRLQDHPMRARVAGGIMGAIPGLMTSAAAASGGPGRMARLAGIAPLTVPITLGGAALGAATIPYLMRVGNDQNLRWLTDAINQNPQARAMLSAQRAPDQAPAQAPTQAPMPQKTAGLSVGGVQPLKALSPIKPIAASVPRVPGLQKARVWSPRPPRMTGVSVNPFAGNRVGAEAAALQAGGGAR